MALFGIPDLFERGYPALADSSAASFLKDVAVRLGIPFSGPPDGGGEWQGAKQLGRGAEGHTALFIRFDPNNTLKERIVVKEVIVLPNSWYHPLRWAGSYHMEGHRDYSAAISHAEASETYIHRKVAASGSGNGSIVTYRGRSRINRRQWRWRMYSGYCAQGSLFDLIRHYDRLKDRYPTEVYSIPEPFIWFTDLNLTKADQTMERGSDGETSAEDWKEVIHRDIKPANCFLGSPTTGQGEFQLYPIPQLGDFGLAVETTPSEPPWTNPRLYRGTGGTPGYQPPEQYRSWFERDTRNYHDAPRLSAATNVFQIGKLLWTLVFLREPPQEPDFSRSRTERSAQTLAKKLTVPGATPPPQARSDELLNLIWQCMALDPNERPSPDRLRQYIEELPDAAEVYFKGMRTIVLVDGEPWFDNDADRDNALEGTDLVFIDNYRVGLSRELLP